MATQGQQRLSDPTQQVVNYDVVDEETHAQNDNDLRPFEKRFVMYHRAILYAFVALMLVTASVVVTYAVTKANDSAASSQSVDSSNSAMPSFLTELKLSAAFETSTFLQSCDGDEIEDMASTCCGYDEFVYWNEEYLCCEGSVETEIISLGYTCSDFLSVAQETATGASVSDSLDQCDCPDTDENGDEVGGPCMFDDEGDCCSFLDLVFEEDKDGDSRWMCCGQGALCVMEKSILAPIATDDAVAGIVHFEGDVAAGLEAAVATTDDEGVSVDSFEQFVANSITVSDDDSWKFEQYKTMFDKTYTDETEESYRRVVFMYNDQVARELDESTTKATFGWTQFSDWTTEEFEAIQGFKFTDDDIKTSAAMPLITNDLVKPTMGRRRIGEIIKAQTRDLMKAPSATIRTNDRRRDDECEDDCGPNGGWPGYKCGEDIQDNGCSWYDENPDACGDYDKGGFSAELMCCACGGGNIPDYDYTPAPVDNNTYTPAPVDYTPAPTDEPEGECQDTTNGATDPYGDGCEWYESYGSYCGYFDDDDFRANEMCCTCGGGLSEPTAEPTADPTTAPTADPTRDPDAKPTSEPTNEPSNEPTIEPTFAPVEGLNINYAELGLTTEIKNQGSCGSCWAFAASGVLESAMLIAGTENAGQKISEQEMVSCSTAGTCNGGWPYSTWTWLQSSTNGACKEETFPYSGTDEACIVDVMTAGMPDAMPASVFKATNWCWDECTDQYLQEEDMANILLDYGPINVNIHASTAWGSYSGGIMDYDTCGGAWASSINGLDHAVVAVGINTNNDPPYWIIRNSWGTWWGDGGYIYLEYGTNTCGIANLPGLVTV